MSRLSITLLSLFIGLTASSAISAVEPTQGMTITGDHELPQVLYIIPWKEQLPQMPAAPDLSNQILRPLIPCDTGQEMGEYQTRLWNCQPIELPSTR